MENGLWSDEIKDKLIMENGSVQNIPEIPTEIKEIYKTVWEMSQKRLLQMARRSVFIDQSQSLNLFISNATKSEVIGSTLVWMEVRIENRYVLFKDSFSRSTKRFRY